MSREPASPPAAPLRCGVSVVVPCYGSEHSVGLVVAQLREVLARGGIAFEIVLVDDASRDRTGAVVDELAAACPEVTAIHLARNYGQHAALLCGIRAARFDVVVTIDDDLQHPPDQVPRLLAALTEDVDVVYGPAEREPHGVVRGLASRAAKWLLQVPMGRTARTLSALRVFRTRLRDQFAAIRGPFVSIDVLLARATDRITAVTVRHDARTIGASTYTLRKLLVHAVTMMAGRLAWAGRGLDRPAYVVRSTSRGGEPTIGSPTG